MYEISKYSLIIGVGNVGLFLYSRIGVLFLGHYNYIEQTGYFEITNKILTLILIPFTILSQVIAPDITKYFAQKKYDIIRNKFVKYLCISLVLSILIVAILFFGYKYLLNSFLPQYSTLEMNNIVRLMMIVYFTQLLNGIIPTGFVTSTGHAKLSTIFLLAFGALNLILNYLFINQYGFIGVIYALIVTKCTADLLFIYTYHRILQRLR